MLSSKYPQQKQPLQTIHRFPISFLAGIVIGDDGGPKKNRPQQKTTPISFLA
jgi:hypothetical protein